MVLTRILQAGKALTVMVALCSFVNTGMAQEGDSLRTKQLSEVTISGEKIQNLERLPAIDGTRLWSGKKNEVINMSTLDANVAEKNARQIFAKVPGVFVYDMDGTGNQVNISTRGLDPHRGWEFNIRRNDAITNSDMYGYPASHFSMPMEAVERIQLVRGTGSLQYGAQFGGMINYITKKADTTRRFSFESVNSIGSFGLLSTYNAVGGRIGKVDYYAYIHNRVADGYRRSSRSDAQAQAALIAYRPSDRVTLNFEISHSKYLHQLAGALNDEEFAQDPRQATRSRNYYSPDIYIPSVELVWDVSENTTVKWLTSAVLGTRNSVMFDRPANIPDVIDPFTQDYAHRQVDIDRYNSYTSELRLLHKYNLFDQQSALVAGVQLMNNDLHRRQQGIGTTGNDYDLSLVLPGWGRDMHFRTSNIAAFVENRLLISDRFSISPGMRVESGTSDLQGKLSYYPDETFPNEIVHQFALFGVNVQYTLSPYQNFYAGFAQSYRPVILKDIVPSSVFEKVDDNLQDADGYNLEAGFRGMTSALRWDVGVYQVSYNNRLGMLVENDADNGNTIYLRTNIGNSVSRGAELFLEYYFPVDKFGLSVFSSTALQDARYKDATIRMGDENVNIDGNKVESAPELISRNGVNLRLRFASISVLYSYTAKSYADALNIEKPTVTGAMGAVPAYSLVDINTTWKISPSLLFRFNVNNVLDKSYFTKRPQFYPGPGIWPSDGRSFVATFGIML